ncbi:MAG: alanine racemase, partial [Clostridiales bacterium]|nr:alanine racemase [Clostridiales bacterium]
MPLIACRTTRLSVHLGAFRHNVRLLRSHLASDTQLMVVVKANASGHGLVEISRAAVTAGADWLGVATAEEGVALREAGVSVPVLVLGTVNARGASACVAHNLTMTVADSAGILAVQEAAVSLHKAAHVHLKLDTGMGR